MKEPLQFDAEWDAGELGCGELAIQLKPRIAAVRPGGLFRLIARDPGAPEDIPAWCRLTGHTLVAGRCGPDRAHYFIQKKENA